MKRILFLAVLGLLSFLSCTQKGNESKDTPVRKARAKDECPVGNHKDGVVPIVYGFPSEELFQKADSGLVILAGCILPENPKYFYCKKHQKEF